MKSIRNTHITTLHRTIAYVLLISQLLTSCGGHENILPRSAAALSDTATGLMAIDTAEGVVETSIAVATSSQHMRSPKPLYGNDTPTPITLNNPITATTPPLAHQRRESLKTPVVATKPTSATKPRSTTRYYQPIRSFWHKAALLGPALYNSVGYVNATTVARNQRIGIEPAFAGGLSMDAMGGAPNSLAVSPKGDFALVAAFTGLKVINMTDKSKPSMIGDLSMEAMGWGYACGVALSPNEDFALVAAWHGGLKVINLTNQSKPSLIGKLSISGSAKSVALSPNGYFALVAADKGGLKVIDITDKSQPRLIGDLSIAAMDSSNKGEALSVAWSPTGDFALVGADTGGLKVINITNHSQPKWIGPLSRQAMGGGRAFSVALSNKEDFALVAGFEGGLQVINMTNKSKPSPIGKLSMAAMGLGNAISVALSNKEDFALVAAYSGGFKVINIRDKTQPKLIADLSMQAMDGGLRANSVTVSPHDDFALVATDEGGLKVINLHQYALKIQKSPPLVSLRKLIVLSRLSIDQFDNGEATPIALSLNADFALLAAKRGGLKVINIRDKSQPSLIGNLSMESMRGGSAYGVAWSPQNDFALVAAWDGGLKVIEMTADKSQLKMIGNLSMENMGGGKARSVALSLTRDFALVAADDGGLKVINITNRSNPKLIGNVSMQAMGGGNAQSVALSPNNNFALVAAWSGGLKVVDITNKSKPSRSPATKDMDNCCVGGAVYSVAWSPNGDFALVAAAGAGLKVINITDKSKPSRIAELSIYAIGGGEVRSVALTNHNDFALVAGDGGLQVINITDKSQPSLMLFMRDQGEKFREWSITLSPNQDFALVAGDGGLKVIDTRHTGVFDNPIALAIRNAKGIHYINDTIQVKVGVPAEFVVKVFDVTTQNNILLQNDVYEYEAPEVVLNQEMMGTRSWIEFSRSNGQLKFVSPKVFSGQTLQLIFPINYKNAKYYHVIDFPVASSLGLCTREHAASFLCKDRSLAYSDKLTVTSPEATINLQMQIMNATLRDRIVFVDQQFGALKAAFNSERKTLSAFGPIADINDMLQGLRYSYKPGYKNAKKNVTEVLLKVTLNDGLNKEQVIENDKAVHLGKFIENKGPVVRTRMQAQLAKVSGIRNGNELIINHELAFSLSENTFQYSNTQTLTYTPSKLPAWLQFNAFTRKFSGKPEKSADMKCEVIELTASDGYDSIKDNFTLNVTNIAPVINRTLSDQLKTITNIRNNNTLIIGHVFDFTFASNTFVSEAHDRLSLQIQGKPSWLTFDADARKLYGKPNEVNQMQVYTMNLTANDGYDAVTDSFTLNVTNIPPVIRRLLRDQLKTVRKIRNGNQLIIGQSFDFTFASDTFVSEAHDRLFLQLQGKPSWLTFDGDARKLYGKPNEVNQMQLYTMELIASDGYDNVTDSFTLNVTNIPPVINRTLSDQLKTVSNIRNGNQLIIGQALDFTFASDTFFSDGHDKLTLTLQGKPSWLIFDTDARKLSGRPNEKNQMQLYTMNLTASDGYDSITDRFTLNVTNIPPRWKKEPPCDSLIRKKYEIDEEVSINLASCIENQAAHELDYTVTCTKQSNHKACRGDIVTLEPSTKLLTIAPKSTFFSFDMLVNNPARFFSVGDYGAYSLTLNVTDKFGGKFEETYDTKFDFQYDVLAWFVLKRALLLISPLITLWGYRQIAPYFYSMCYKEKYTFDCDPVDIGETYNLKFKVRKQKSIADAAWLLQAMQEANSLDEEMNWYDRYTDLARPDILERAIEDIVAEKLAAIRSQHMLQYGITKVKDCFSKHTLSRRLSRLDGNHEWAMKYIQKAINEKMLEAYPTEAVDHMDKILYGVSILAEKATSAEEWVSTLVNPHGEINKNLLDRYAREVLENRGEKGYDAEILSRLLFKAHYAADYGLTLDHEQVINDESAYYLTIKAYNEVPDRYLSFYRKFFKERHIKWFNMNYQSMPQSSDYRAPSPMPMWLNCSISNDQIEFYGKPSSRDIGTYVIQILDYTGYILKEFKVVVQGSSMTTAALGLPQVGSVRELGRRTRMLNSMTSHGSIASQVAGQEIEMALLGGVRDAIPEEWLTASGQVGMDD